MSTAGSRAEAEPSPTSSGALVLPLAAETESSPELLGGKGHNLIELIRLGAPVPPGFVVSTRARAALHEGGGPTGALLEEVRAQVGAVEKALGRDFGGPGAPLVVSVRSGAPTSMPGMMDTILNVGIGDATLDALAQELGEETAADCYARLVEMFGTTVAGLPESVFDPLRRRGAPPRELLDAYREAAGSPFPQDPWEQLSRAIGAVAASWDSDRARRYRRFRRIPDTGTAIVVQAMVFGNAGQDSGTGVVFTRDPSTGAPGLFGEYLPAAQGEDIVSGRRGAEDISAMQRSAPAAGRELAELAARVEERFGDMCEIELTVERGRLWILQSRIGQRSGQAAIRIAVELARDGSIEVEEALRRVEPEALAREFSPRLDSDAIAADDVIATGIGAAPGVARGPAAFDSAAASRLRAAGEEPILVRPETRPEDLEGILAAAGLLTSRGGKTSHAAVVARGLGRSCVCGAEELAIDTEAGLLRAGEFELREGEPISIDGESGRVLRGLAKLRPAQPSEQALALLGWADERRAVAVDALLARPAEFEDAFERGADGAVVEVPPGVEDPSAAVRDALEAAAGRPLAFWLRGADAEAPARMAAALAALAAAPGAGGPLPTLLADRLPPDQAAGAPSNARLGATRSLEREVPEEVRLEGAEALLAWSSGPGPQRIAREGDGPLWLHPGAELEAGAALAATQPQARLLVGTASLEAARFAACRAGIGGGSPGCR